jgi:hypothetical protein
MVLAGGIGKKNSEPAATVITSADILARATAWAGETEAAERNLQHPLTSIDYDIFESHSRTAETTMVPDAYVRVLTGGVGLDELREFYSKKFIPQMPPDTEMTAIRSTRRRDDR